MPAETDFTSGRGRAVACNRLINEIHTAACPSEAIVFGDLNDQASRVRGLSASPLGYGVLEELNTRPRITYLAAVRNPNPALQDSLEEDSHA